MEITKTLLISVDDITPEDGQCVVGYNENIRDVYLSYGIVVCKVEEFGPVFYDAYDFAPNCINDEVYITHWSLLPVLDKK